jgi:NADH-quinone oxidoreductase subunit J
MSKSYLPITFYVWLFGTTLFFFIALVIVFSSLGVIFSKHPVFSLLFLVVSFIFSSFLLFLLECEFVALLLIVVYVGAIAILFLFSIMMLESKAQDLSKNTTRYLPIGLIFALILLVPVLGTIDTFFYSSTTLTSLYINNYLNWYDLIESTDDITVFGKILYTYFALHILLAGLLLLVVLLGVVYLTNSYEKYSKQQSAFKQLSRMPLVFI